MQALLRQEARRSASERERGQAGARGLFKEWLHEKRASKGKGKDNKGYQDKGWHQ